MSVRLTLSLSGVRLEIGPGLLEIHKEAIFDVAVFWSGVEFCLPRIGLGAFFWTPRRWSQNRFSRWDIA